MCFTNMKELFWLNPLLPFVSLCLSVHFPPYPSRRKQLPPPRNEKDSENMMWNHLEGLWELLSLSFQFLIKFFFIGWYIALYLCQFFFLSFLHCVSVRWLPLHWKAFISFTVIKELINCSTDWNIITVENWSSICS